MTNGEKDENINFQSLPLAAKVFNIGQKRYNASKLSSPACASTEPGVNKYKRTSSMTSPK
jgi:hypothetical protein